MIADLVVPTLVTVRSTASVPRTLVKWQLWPLLTGAILETARSVIVRHQQLLLNLNSCDKHGDLQKKRR